MTQPVYVLRQMRQQDLSQVTAIDRISFSTPWSLAAYQYELASNAASRMVALSLPGQPALWRRGLAGWVERLLGRHKEAYRIVGYGGFWLNRGEAHISTIATHPHYRGLGLGELLLAAMIRQSVLLQAQLVSLEVRASNNRAINLYRKYAFAFHGVTHGYYRDDGEDAYDMRLAPLDDTFKAHFGRRWRDLQRRIPFVDQFTTTSPVPASRIEAA